VRDYNSFVELVDVFMQAETKRLFDRVPSATHLADSGVLLDERYYLRHRIETVKRIWLTSQTDALALAAMVEEDYEAARWWSKYIYQELNHDILYVKDLEKHGLTLEEIALTPVYPATTAMVSFIRNSIPLIGSIAAVAYSVWVEWNSDKTSELVVTRARKKFSPNHVKGASAHVGIDINEDHYAIMVKIVYQLIQRNAGDELSFFDMLRNLTNFVADYFIELQEECSLDEAVMPVKDGAH